MPSVPSVPSVPSPDVPGLDTDAIAATRGLVADDPRFGRLLDAVVWAAGAQAACPPRPYASPVVLLVGAGEALVEDGLPERRLTAGEPPGAYEVGTAAVDAEVDGGADLLLVGASGRGLDAAAAVVSVLTGREPVACVRRGGDAAAWTASVTAVRDARRRGKPCAAAPLALLAEVGDADLALLTGVLVQAAVRRTPVLLEGLTACAAGLVAEAYAPGCSLWWALASSDGDPAAGFAAAALELDPLLDLGLGFPALTGSRLALPLLQAAIGAVPRD